ncbi:MAG TPA: serine hydrolase, partial [Chryseolinea sp.]|nr:serine hydrolase [Chryseolinea sp.]
MKNLYTVLSRHACVYMLLSFLLLPFLLQAQKKQSAVVQATSPDAIYNANDAGKYMRKWWLLGPIPVTKDSTSNVDMATQIKFFDQDPLSISELHAAKKTSVSVDGKGLAWSLYSSKKDIIDLDSLFKCDLAVVYASSEVIADSSYQAFLAVGSDDGVKVWHNKKLVHKNWIPRGVVPDQDIIAIPLEKGINHILIAVQDIHQGWGFTARFLDKAALSERLVAESARGNLDDINLLLKAGADVNTQNPSGIMALDAARLNGRNEVVKLLLQNGARDQAMPAPEKLVDALYSSLTTKNAPGVAVLISQDGKIVYKKTFGYADIAKKEKVSTETKFRIGSITKQFTAASILKLQEENRLSVTDKLSKYFPDFPRAEEVTLHHLLTHTSGIHSYTGKNDFIQKVIKPVTNEELLTYFKNDPYDFNPGEQYRYNNSGYFLLGYIIEKVSGKSYSKYLKDTFFDPLQMKNTGVHTTTLKLKNEAKGHMKSGTKYDMAPNWDMSWAGGAGALYSTVDDL